MATVNVVRKDSQIKRIALEITDPQQIEDFKRLVQRSLNTWESPPKWLVQVSDELMFGVPLLSAKVF